MWNDIYRNREDDCAVVLGRYAAQSLKVAKLKDYHGDSDDDEDDSEDDDDIDDDEDGGDDL